MVNAQGFKPSVNKCHIFGRDRNIDLHYVDGVTEPNVMHQECGHIDYEYT
jgi:hypothetical protein